MESWVVSEFEGTLLRDSDPFSYFMLVAFEASAGLLRFTLLLLLWPAIRLLAQLGFDEPALRLMIFVALAGVKASDVETIARAVLPKFYVDDVDMGAWRVFSSHGKRVVVTTMPTVMVEMFAREHLRADAVIGTELAVNRFGYATGFTETKLCQFSSRVADLFGNKRPSLGMGRASPAPPFLSLCKEQLHTPFATDEPNNAGCEAPQLLAPIPVVFHDGRLVKRPTPSMALLILVWLPVGVVLAIIRIAVGLTVPLGIIPVIAPIFGGRVTMKGKPPPPVSNNNTTGVLFVCTHRTLMDPVVLSTILGRKIPAVTYSLSRFSEILSPIPTVRLTRIREVDAEKIKRLLEKGDLVVCPEGTTCREPFLLRFSALFAELTDRIVPVAMDYKVGLFHATTARGWKALDPIFFMMNPRPIYEATFLSQLPAEATCSSGKSPHDVANYVQRILATALGFECTNFTRRDKYLVLAGNDGTVSCGVSWANGIREVVKTFKPTIFH
ncbi:hypothetical protein SAY87_007748 [Trapa incisa]|uniref:Phospholipid/glycerol acyltransferase domain-containing protein n=2 Tax=Trapa TaxID=22665 RepID=A0AAN7QRD7_TRANT|nr:hypothetical protein SAY87_007748 [Trapa incisa]KAK4776689.1 hypothetical protein SAY86_005377 [Trapa natans]